MARKTTAAPAEETVDTEPTAASTDTEQVTDAAPVETTDDSAAAETAEQPASWWSRAGDDFQGVENDAQALERLNTIRQRDRDELQRANQYAQHYAAQLQAREEQRQAEAAKQPQEPWWKKHYNPPEFNPAWRQEWLQANPQTGVAEFKPDTPPDIRQKMLEHARFAREQREKFEANPYEYVYQGLADKIREEARAEAMQAVQGHQLTQQFYALRQADADWLFGKDAAGNPDPSQPTQANLTFRAFLQPLIKAGVPLEEAWATARERTAHRFPAQQAAQQVSQVNEQKKREFTNGAGPRPNRGNTLRGAANPAAPPQNGSLDLAAMMRADAEAQGVNLYAPVGL